MERFLQFGRDRTTLWKGGKHPLMSSTGTRLRELLERRRAEAASALAEAERKADETGKQPFDYALFRKLCRNADPDSETEAEHRRAYYVGHPEMQTVIEYVAYLESIAPWSDSR